jgi:hypothetical protein
MMMLMPQQETPACMYVMKSKDFSDFSLMNNLSNNKFHTRHIVHEEEEEDDERDRTSFDESLMMLVLASDSSSLSFFLPCNRAAIKSNFIGQTSTFALTFY